MTFFLNLEILKMEHSINQPLASFVICLLLISQFYMIFVICIGLGRVTVDEIVDWKILYHWRDISEGEILRIIKIN